jgi:hypothetical protein
VLAMSAVAAGISLCHCFSCGKKLLNDFNRRFVPRGLGFLNQVALWLPKPNFRVSATISGLAAFCSRGSQERPIHLSAHGPPLPAWRAISNPKDLE